MEDYTLQKELWYQLSFPQKLKDFLETRGVREKDKWLQFADSSASHLFLWIPADIETTREEQDLLQSEDILKLQDEFCAWILDKTVNSPYCPSNLGHYLLAVQKFWKLENLKEITSLRQSLNDRELDMWDNCRQFNIWEPLECMFIAGLVIYPFLYAPEQIRVFWELKKDCFERQ